MDKINIISDNASIKDGLIQLESITNGVYTLFVLDKQNKLLGTITDGDIRRFIIAGGKNDDSVTDAMNVKYRYVRTDEEHLIAHLHEFRKLGIWIIPIIDKDKHLIDIYDLKRLKSILPIDAVLMAGGKGERLRPLTEKRPKPLIKVGDKCIIDYNIDRLIDYGVSHINVTVNYLKEQLHEHFSQPRNGVKVHTIEEPKYLGTIGSIKFINEFHNDTILVMNSDLFTNIDFEDFYLHFREHDADMSVAAIPYNVTIPFGILELDGRNITNLLEKPKYNYYANGGIYLIRKDIIKEIPDDTFFNATDLVEKLISLKKNVIRYPINGTWIDIGQHADLLKAQELVKHLNNR